MRFLVRSTRGLGCFGRSRCPVQLRCGVLGVTVNRKFSSGEDEVPSKDTFGWKVANYLNQTIDTAPRQFLVCLIVADIGSIGLCYSAIQVANIAVPADFAFAFLLSRPLKRIRLPVEIGVAAALAKAFPWLSAVKISNVVRSFSPSGKETMEPSPNQGMLARFLHSGTKLLDKYGLAYQVGARTVGATIVFSFFFALRMGVDIQGILAEWGFQPSTGEAAGAYAAAVVSSGLLYPATLGIAAKVARIVGKK